MNTVLEITARAAFNRLTPIVDQYIENKSLVQAEVAIVYDMLPVGERKEFRELCKERYKWEARYVRRLAQIGREFPHKAQLIWGKNGRGGDVATPDIDTSIQQELVTIPDEVLKGAVADGMFDKPVTVKDVRTLRTTGKPPAKKKRIKKVATLQTEFASLNEHLDAASLSIAKITKIIHDDNIREIKGREVTRFVRRFEKLCASVATTIPDLAERGFDVLRGDL